MKLRRATPPIGGDGFLLLLLLLQLILLGPRCTGAQPSPPSNSSGGGGRNNELYPYGFKRTRFSPSMAIVIVVLISAFFFIVFFSVYMRQCGGGDSVGRLAAAATATAARSRRQRGLVPEVLATFPTLVYSEVKGLKIGKGVLECAVCLSEFEDDETLRLLPPCSHVFHPDCIDAWLAFHVTCPVCRCNLAGPDHADGPASPGPAGPETPAAVANSEEPARAAGEGEQDVLDEVPPDHVAIAVDGGASADRKTELDELSRIASRRRAVGSRSRARPPRFPRSYSTGHSPVPAHQAENLDRFTLRLPEDIRREIVAAGRLQRAASLRAFPVGLERSTRRGYRGVDGSFRAGRSIRLGRSGHWSAFFGRNFSARFPALASGKRWDEEGSVKKGEGCDGSTRGKLPSVRAQFDCLGRGGAKPDSTAGDDESYTTRPRV